MGTRLLVNCQRDLSITMPRRNNQILLIPDCHLYGPARLVACSSGRLPGTPPIDPSPELFPHQSGGRT